MKVQVVVMMRVLKMVIMLVSDRKSHFNNEMDSDSGSGGDDGSGSGSDRGGGNGCVSMGVGAC